jgi:formate-dependent nitrite reductase membrane component NrfD
MPDGSGEALPAAGCGEIAVAELELWAEAEPWRPQAQTSWRTNIALYLYLGGIGAGSFAVSVVADWIGLPLPSATQSVAGITVNWALLLCLAGPLVAALGASLLLADLGSHWLRFMTACFNPRSSWMARGFLILVGFIVFGCATMFIKSLGVAPFMGAAWPALQVVALVFALATLAYTGILLQSMQGIPAWQSPLLPVLFSVSAFSTGCAAILVILLTAGVSWDHSFTATETAGALAWADLAFVVGEACVLAAYLLHLLRARPDKPEATLSARLLLSGRLRWSFWLGVVGATLAAPVVADSVFHITGVPVVLVIGCCCLIAGGFVLRAVILAAGVRAQPPLVQLGQWQAGNEWDGRL